MTTVILTAVLAGKTGALHHPQSSGDQGHYSVRHWVDTPGFAQASSSTRQEVGRKSPHRRLASFKASAALGFPPQRFSPVRAPGDSPARTQVPQARSCNRQERTTQAVHPSPRRTHPMGTVSGPTRRGPSYPNCSCLSGFEPEFGGTDVSYIGGRAGALSKRRLSSLPTFWARGIPPPWTWMRNFQWAGTGVSPLFR